MFAKLAEYLTHQLENENVIMPERRELYKYGFQNGLILALNFATSLLIGVAFGKVLSSVLLLAAYMPLKSYAGGHHSRSSERCYVVSTLIMIVWLSLIKFKHLSASCCAIMLVIGSAVCIALAPVEGENKPLDESEYRTYRKRSLVILCVEIIIWKMLTDVGETCSEIIPIVIFTEAVMLVLGEGAKLLKKLRGA